MHKKKWFDYLWLVTIVYLSLGFFNILFAWLGMICFCLPLLIALVKGSKAYCNKYCGRGQLFEVVGKGFKISRNKTPPKFLYSLWFRYGFLVFFMTMFFLMIVQTYRVFKGADIQETITLLWMFQIPGNWSDVSFVPPWMAQFAFGLYSVMLTSTILGFATMLVFKPRSWCVYCPMGTMTQGICRLKYRKVKP